MATRQKTARRRPTETSFSGTKVAPKTVPDSAHQQKFNDQTVTPRKREEESKFITVPLAIDNNDYLEAIRQMSLFKPETVNSLYIRGCIRLELRQFSQTQRAIIDFTRSIDLSSERTPPLFIVEVLYKRAFAYQTIGQLEDAITDYNNFIDRCRSYGKEGKAILPKGLISRGLTYQAMKELDKALKDINAANKLAGARDPYYLCCRASVYVSKHQKEKAIEDLDRASEMGAHQDIDALFQRAFVLGELRQRDAALNDLQKALTLSHRANQQAEVHFRRGLSECTASNREKAIDSFEKAVNMNSFHARAYFRVGILQAGDEQFKEALKALNGTPEVDDVAQDGNSGTRPLSPSSATITMLEDRAEKLREDIDRNGSLTRTHFELALTYDGLFAQEKDIEVRAVNHRKAVIEYQTAIQHDVKNLYPQARALLALCQLKMNNFVAGYDWHLEFYEILSEHEESVHHWIAYLKDVKEKMASGKLDPYLDKNAARKLIQMEMNRSKMSIDQHELNNDREDTYKNQLAFYTQLRFGLSTLLAAIALAGFDNDIIAKNVQSTPNIIGTILELFSRPLSYVPEIVSLLSNGAKVVHGIDYETVKILLKQIGSVGDITDQVAIAQLVARHLCTRYRWQLICLKPTIHPEVVEQPSSSKWSCFGCKSISSEEQPSSNWHDLAERVATFAVAFIIQVMSSEKIRISSKGKSSREEALASMLVLIACRAQRGVVNNVLQSIPFRYKETLPLDHSIVSQMLKELQQPMTETVAVPKNWDLYEFFQAPGIYYHPTGETKKFSYFDMGASMKANVYGYRLGTQEETELYK